VIDKVIGLYEIAQFGLHLVDLRTLASARQRLMPAASVQQQTSWKVSIQQMVRRRYVLLSIENHRSPIARG
jgi:hypothetical protein